jgi:DNA-directed RNA polymerase subunit omega
MAAQRVRQLRKGSEPTLPSKNKDVVLALREIAAGNVTKKKILESISLTETNVPAFSEGSAEIPETVEPVVVQKDKN